MFENDLVAANKPIRVEFSFSESPKVHESQYLLTEYNGYENINIKTNAHF